jgi:hypothetical protein
MDFLEEIGYTEKYESPEEYVPPKKKVNIWHVMNSSLDKRMNPSLEEKRKIPEYLFHNLLTKFEGTIPLALIFTTREIPVEHQYDIVRNNTPKIKIPFEKKNQEESELLERISKYYNCSLSVAKEYEDIMTEQEKNRIFSLYETGKGR